MTATLYSLRLSHPAYAAGLMLERKGIEHRVRNLPAGFHPLLLRAAGFRGGTVPALMIDGRRIQRSREISAALDAIQPEPALFPADPDRRRAVVAAEEWSERVLQPVPRRLLRWGASSSLAVRRWLVGIERMPAPGLMATMRLLAAFDDLRETVVSTAAGALGMRILPDFDYSIPRFLPQPWLRSAGA